MTLLINQKQDSLWPNYPMVFKPLKGIIHYPKTINDKRDKRNEMKKDFTNAYKIISDKIYQFTFTMDNLNDAILAILENLDTIELKENSPLNYLSRACMNRFKNTYNADLRHNLFRDKIGKKIVESDNGITNEFIEMLLS